MEITHESLDLTKFVGSKIEINLIMNQISLSFSGILKVEGGDYTVDSFGNHIYFSKDAVRRVTIIYKEIFVVLHSN